MLNFSTAKIPPPVTPKAPRVRVRKPPSPEPKVPIVLRQDPTPWGPERVDVPIVVGSFEQRFVLSMVGFVFPWSWLKLLPIQLVHYDWFIDLLSIVGAARFLVCLGQPCIYRSCLHKVIDKPFSIKKKSMSLDRFLVCLGQPCIYKSCLHKVIYKPFFHLKNVISSSSIAFCIYLNISYFLILLNAWRYTT